MWYSVEVYLDGVGADKESLLKSISNILIHRYGRKIDIYDGTLFQKKVMKTDDISTLMSERDRQCSVVSNWFIAYIPRDSMWLASELYLCANSKPESEHRKITIITPLTNNYFIKAITTDIYANSSDFISAVNQGMYDDFVADVGNGTAYL